MSVSVDQSMMEMDSLVSVSNSGATCSTPCKLITMQNAVSDTLLIGSTLGALSFLLIVGVVLGVMCICCYVRYIIRKKTNSL